MRSERDAIAGLKKYILEWGVTDEASLKAIDKAAKEEVDVAVEEAKKSAFPDLKEFWTDIYVSRLGVAHGITKVGGGLTSSTRALSPPSCEDERRRRSTSTTSPLPKWYIAVQSRVGVNGIGGRVMSPPAWAACLVRMHQGI